MAGATIVILLIYALWYGLSSSNRAEVNVPPPLPTTAQPVPALSSDAAPPGAAGLTAPVASTAAPTPSGIPPAAPGIVVAGPAAPATAAMAAETPPVPDKKDVAIKDTEPKDASKETKTVYGDANTVSRLIIRATQSSWIMITDDSGKAVFDHVLKPGETYKVPNKPGLSLTTGNGSGIELLLDGNPLPKVAGGAPHVVRNIPLDPDRLTAAPSAPEHN